jgi:O-glycosyl hydrolase
MQAYMKMKLNYFLIFLFVFSTSKSQINELKYIPAEIDFDIKINDWDGFGFNYVEAAQTRDYASRPQDYGGFSLLTEKQKQEILGLVFGEHGLQVQIVKMFLDPWHQKTAQGPFDHEWTTRNMRYFVGKGLELTRQRGDDLEIIATLYGPPSWATQQDSIGGRDLDTTRILNLCDYMAHWVKYLKDNDYPVKYLSLHNEGEDFYRWNYDKGTQRLEKFDYNMYWPPEQVNTFLKTAHRSLDKFGLKGISLTNGEPSNWTRFFYWGYAHSLYNDPLAMANIGLLTTHGFINGDMSKLSYGFANPLTTDLLREKREHLHAWVTSFSWGATGIDFLRMMQENIYTAKVNAVIPWAGIQNPSQWIGGDPNPGTALIVNDDGTYEVTNWYYFYKQLTVAGRRGMSVVKAWLASPQAHIIAFDDNGSKNPDAFVLTSNIYIWGLPIEIKLKGTKSTRFKAYRTTVDGSEHFQDIGIFEVNNGSIIYDPPQGSTTTFIALD